MIDLRLGNCLDVLKTIEDNSVAAVTESTNFIGIEMDEKYFDISRMRISERESNVPSTLEGL